MTTDFIDRLRTTTKCSGVIVLAGLPLPFRRQNVTPSTNTSPSNEPPEASGQLAGFRSGAVPRRLLRALRQCTVVKSSAVPQRKDAEKYQTNSSPSSVSLGAVRQSTVMSSATTSQQTIAEGHQTGSSLLSERPASVGQKPAIESTATSHQTVAKVNQTGCLPPNGRPRALRQSTAVSLAEASQQTIAVGNQFDSSSSNELLASVGQSPVIGSTATSQQTVAKVNQTSCLPSSERPRAVGESTAVSCATTSQQTNNLTAVNERERLRNVCELALRKIGAAVGLPQDGFKLARLPPAEAFKPYFTERGDFVDDLSSDKAIVSLETGDELRVLIDDFRVHRATYAKLKPPKELCDRYAPQHVRYILHLVCVLHKNFRRGYDLHPAAIVQLMIHVAAAKLYGHQNNKLPAITDEILYAERLEVFNKLSSMFEKNSNAEAAGGSSPTADVPASVTVAVPQIYRDTSLYCSFEGGTFEPTSDDYRMILKEIDMGLYKRVDSNGFFYPGSSAKGGRVAIEKMLRPQPGRYYLSVIYFLYALHHFQLSRFSKDQNDCKRQARLCGIFLHLAASGFAATSSASDFRSVSLWKVVTSDRFNSARIALRDVSIPDELKRYWQLRWP